MPPLSCAQEAGSGAHRAGDTKPLEAERKATDMAKVHSGVPSPQA